MNRPINIKLPQETYHYMCYMASSRDLAPIDLCRDILDKSPYDELRQKDIDSISGGDTTHWHRFTIRVSHYVYKHIWEIGVKHNKSLCTIASAYVSKMVLSVSKQNSAEH